MDYLTLISLGLYKLVNRIVGSESEVSMRRMVMGLEHEVKIVEYKFDPAVEAEHLSGSEAEGLRFSSSDRDIMYIIRDIRVIFSLSQLPRNNIMTLLMAECEGLRPGFYLLRLVTNTLNSLIIDACLNQHNVKSSLWRNQFLFKESNNIHGPCTSGIAGSKEFDFAFCIKSDIWPDVALDCIQRLRHTGWPSQDALSKIIEEGCLFVPIGSKGSPFEEYEWRLSFSLAEKILIHNMTHTQFLTYGLLKIFLKEAIDSNLEVKGLLCSYFLKTILFWEIIKGTACREENFLQNFWKCFETLIEYVISGYCPNFFIPENNMFRGKVEGEAQRKLLSHLITLYRTGYGCFLQCPSVQGVMRRIFQQPMVALMLPNDHIISTKSFRDTKLILEIWNRTPPLNDEQQVNIAILLQAESMLSNNPSETVSFVLKTWIKLFVQKLCIMVLKHTHQRNSVSRKILYKTGLYVIKTIMTSSNDATTHLFFAAFTLYDLGKFAAAINILKEAKIRLQHPCIIYPWILDRDKYRAAGGDTTPISCMMKTVVGFPVTLAWRIRVLGLEIEHIASSHHISDRIVFPPLVIVNFFLFLCYRHEHNIEQSNAALNDLSTLVHYDEGYHIRDVDRAISWQLLGICHEMSGDYQGAYYSYITAMQQRWCPIRSASEIRIRNMCSYIGSMQ